MAKKMKLQEPIKLANARILQLNRYTKTGLSLIPITIALHEFGNLTIRVGSNVPTVCLTTEQVGELMSFLGGE